MLALHRSYDRLRGATGLGVAGEAVEVAPVDMSSFIQRLSTLSTDDDPGRVAEYVERAQTAESRTSCIDILRTEGVLPKRGAAAAKGEPAQGGDLRSARSEAIARRSLPALAASSARMGRRAQTRGRAALPRPARARTRRACATRTCGRRATRPMSGSSSTSSRTPTRSRSRSRCCWRRPIADIASRDWYDDPLLPERRGAAVLRRRPEAVDLPVPPGRRRPLPARARGVRPHAAAPHGELPHASSRS